MFGNYGIDELRKAVKLFDNGNEGFNQRYTAEQLVTLWRAYRACSWDIPPDQWDAPQLHEALELGWMPVWTADELPAFPEERQRFA